ncbi:unnamed protein product [Fraxinus pennsylvanica]|uniref:F-box domain-containing protein n=1 Tax=Fraxinus pennsylvanica TaxID=56036 RepID=A0AAD1ZLJ8_9LAMI|nr:unnamed protein product [Fraxinus pennsylvanica]
MDPGSSSAPRQPTAKRKQRKHTTVGALGHDVLCMIFSLLDLVHLIRCSAVCKSWSIAIRKLKLLQIQYQKQHQIDAATFSNASAYSERLLNIHLEQLAMEQHKFSLQEGPADIFQWKGHLTRVNLCRMKMGMILTGVGDKVMRLWSAESCKCLDEYFLPDKAPLIDFDFDEGKVVGLVGTRICIWKRIGIRDIFSSRDGLFTKGLCMRYVDPQAVIGCEDGKVRVFDMYSRKCSQIIKMHSGSVTCLSFSDDQLIVSGSSLGSLTMSDLSSDQRVATLSAASSAGIKTLCLNPSSHLLFAGSTDGFASCWDLRTLRAVWKTRISPNVLYSMGHLRNDKSTLVVGGIDGIVRILDQENGLVLSGCIMDESSNVRNRSTEKYGAIQKNEVKRLSEDAHIDLMPHRPPIKCLGVGMQKIVTTHNDKYIRLWKFHKT